MQSRCVNPELGMAASGVEAAQLRDLRSMDGKQVAERRRGKKETRSGSHVGVGI